MPTLHFAREELERRIRAACASMRDEGLDGLILFRQDSMYYLTGYDTSGYTMFQGMYLGAGGELALLTRTADRIQSRETSIVTDVRIWYDREDATPGEDLRAMLEDYGCRGLRLGVEYHAYGLTGQRAKMVDAALDGFCDLVDASDLVRLLRLVKSDAELEYVRRAGALCDRMLEVAIERTVPGASVMSVYGAMIQALCEGGGDPTASRWPMGAGDKALFGRYHTGDETVGERDQVVFEPGAAYRHYHACTMYKHSHRAAAPEARRHESRLRRRARCLPGCAAARAHHRRSLRRARQDLRARGLRGRGARGLRLYDGRDVPADLDGLAHAVVGKPPGHRARDGVLPPHDPVRPGRGSEHDDGGDRHRHRGCLRAG